MPALPKLTRTTAAALGAATLALALGAWAFWGGKEDIALRTATVERGPIQVTVLAAGAIEAAQLVSVGARVSGQVEKLAVTLGQEVQAGDLIAQIDAQEQQNELLKAKASLAQIEAQITAKSSNLRKAEAALSRQSQLSQSELVSQVALEAAAAEVEVNKADLAALIAQRASAEVTVAQGELAIARTQVVAPISGTVVAVAVKEGQTLSAAQNAPTIVKIASLDQMIVKAEISEADVVQVKAGQSASFSILGQPETLFDAVVRAIEPAPASLAENDKIPTDKAVYYNGLLEVDNTARTLRIGMTAQVSIVLDSAEDALTVPVSAVTYGPEGAMVQVMSGEEIETRPVTTGLNDKVRVQITQGLTEGETVLLSTSFGGDGFGGAAAPAPAMAM